MKWAFANIHSLEFSVRHTLHKAASGQMNEAARLDRDSGYQQCAHF